MNKKDSATSTALKLMGEHAVLWDELALSVQGSGVQSVPSGPWFPQNARGGGRMGVHPALSAMTLYT